MLVAKAKDGNVYKNVKVIDGFVAIEKDGQIKFEPADLFRLLELSERLITLIWNFFPIRVPTSIKSENVRYGYTERWVSEDIIKVGYQDESGNDLAGIFATDTSERQAKKKLQRILQLQGVA